jgi:hypothetical protein
MTDDDFDDEADALLQYLEQRGLSEQMACAVCGAAIQCLIRDNTLAARGFIRTLANNLKVADELRAAS